MRVRLDCASMGKTKGGSVNISDAFESYGACFPDGGPLYFRVVPIKIQVHSPSERLTMSNASTSFAMPALGPVPVEGCTPPIL